jgi:Flp pilus assembly protein TadD
VLHATSRVEQAVVFYDEALRLRPTHSGAASNLATALHGMGRMADAAPLYVQAVQLSPNNAVLLSNYAIFLNSLKRFQSAYNILMRALSIEPVSADTIVTRDALLPILEREISTINTCKETAIQLVQQGQWDEVVSTLLACGEPSEDAAWWFAIAGMAQHMR